MNYSFPLKQIIVLSLLFILITPAITFAEDAVDKTEVKDISENIYMNYQNKNFKEVYQLLHPAIKEILTEDKYVSFQTENSDKYKLKLSNIEIGEIRQINDLPRKYNEYLNQEDYDQAYEVKINYELNFRFVGTTHNRDVETETYIVELENDYYLIWDRSVIEEDDPGAGVE
ncbi:MAG: hypothetical protein ACQEQG_00370 [Bacillota bacterium]